MPVVQVLGFGDACPPWSLASEGRPGKNTRIAISYQLHVAKMKKCAIV